MWRVGLPWLLTFQYACVFEADPEMRICVQVIGTENPQGTRRPRQEGGEPGSDTGEPHLTGPLGGLSPQSHSTLEAGFVFLPLFAQGSTWPR